MTGMALFNVRNIITLAAGLSASAVAVRKALGKEVDKRADKAIEKAVEEARAEIRAQAQSYFTSGFRRFLLTTLFKALLVSIIAVLFLADVLPSGWSAIALATLFVLFAGYDLIRTLPTLSYLSRELGKHGWRPKLILSEYVSAQVFERVLEKASDEPVDRTESVLMLLAGRKRDEMVERVAKAVAEIAATSSWQDIRPMVNRFVLRFITLFVLYSALVWGVIWLVRMHLE